RWTRARRSWAPPSTWVPATPRAGPTAACTPIGCPSVASAISVGERVDDIQARGGSPRHDVARAVARGQKRASARLLLRAPSRHRARERELGGRQGPPPRGVPRGIPQGGSPPRDRELGAPEAGRGADLRRGAQGERGPF